MGTLSEVQRGSGVWNTLQEDVCLYRKAFGPFEEGCRDLSLAGTKYQEQQSLLGCENHFAFCYPEKSPRQVSCDVVV